jgi:hypothetical protein
LAAVHVQKPDKARIILPASGRSRKHETVQDGWIYNPTCLRNPLQNRALHAHVRQLSARNIAGLPTGFRKLWTTVAMVLQDTDSVGAASVVRGWGAPPGHQGLWPSRSFLGFWKEAQSLRILGAEIVSFCNHVWPELSGLYRKQSESGLVR